MTRTGSSTFPTDADGNSVLEIFYKGNKLTWDGKNDFGIFVSNGVYILQFVKVDDAGVEPVVKAETITVLRYELKALSDVKIIPNPVDFGKTKNFKVRFNALKDSVISIRIYDLAGELVKGMKTAKAANEIIIDMSTEQNNLASGLYVLVIEAKAPSGRFDRIIQKFTLLK